MKSQQSKSQKTLNSDQGNGLLSKFKNPFVSNRSNNSNPPNKSAKYDDKKSTQLNVFNKNIYFSKLIHSNYSNEFLSSFNFSKSEFYNQKQPRFKNHNLQTILTSIFKNLTNKPNIIENVFMLVVDDYLNYTCEYILTDKIRILNKRFSNWHRNSIVRPGFKKQAIVPGNITSPENYMKPEPTKKPQEEQRKSMKTNIIKKATDSIKQSADLNNNVSEKIKHLNVTRNKLDYSLSKSQLLDETSQVTLTVPSQKSSKILSQSLINSNSNNCVDKIKMNNKKYLGIFRKKLEKEQVVNIAFKDFKKGLDDYKLNIDNIINIDIAPHKTEMKCQNDLKKCKKSTNKSSDFIYNPKVRRSVTFREPKLGNSSVDQLHKNPEFLSHVEISTTKFNDELPTFDSNKTSRSVSPNTATLPNLSISTDEKKQKSRKYPNDIYNDEISSQTTSGLYYNFNNSSNKKHQKFIFVNKLSHHKSHKTHRSLSPAIVSLRSTPTLNDEKTEQTHEKIMSTSHKKWSDTKQSNKDKNISIIEIINKSNNDKSKVKFSNNSSNITCDKEQFNNPDDTLLDQNSTILQEIIISDNETNTDNDYNGSVQLIPQQKCRKNIFSQLKTANFAFSSQETPILNNGYNDDIVIQKEPPLIYPSKSIKFNKKLNSIMKESSNNSDKSKIHKSSTYSIIPMPIKSFNDPKFDRNCPIQSTNPSKPTLSTVPPTKNSFYQHTLSSQQKVRYKHNEIKQKRTVKVPMKFKIR